MLYLVIIFIPSWSNDTFSAQPRQRRNYYAQLSRTLVWIKFFFHNVSNPDPLIRLSMTIKNSRCKTKALPKSVLARVDRPAIIPMLVHKFSS